MPSTIANWRGKGGVQVGDAFVDSGPVQHVLGPSVNAAGNHAEQILHGQRGAHPMVRLHLGHGDQQSRAQRGVGQIELAQTRELARQDARA